MPTTLPSLFSPPPAGALCLLAALAAACQPAESTSAVLDWQAVEYPLFEGLSETCQERSQAAIDARLAGDTTLTEAPDEIRWARDVDEALARATREDKPIFIATSVRKGGLNKSGCDV